MTPSVPDPEGAFDVVIIGAGACGAEAAWRLAGQGRTVALVTTSLDTVYAAPAERARLGGPAGSLAEAVAADVRPDADGTVSAWTLHTAAKYRLEGRTGVHLLQSNVEGLITEDGRATGVRTWEGVPRRGRAVALCAGSFLRARLRVGEAEERAGRPGEMAYDDLADDLAARGVRMVAARHAGGGDGPAWEVRFERLAEDERAGMRLVRIPGVFAAGVCAHGPLDVETATHEGIALADAVHGWLEPT